MKLFCQNNRYVYFYLFQKENVTETVLKTMNIKDEDLAVEELNLSLRLPDDLLDEDDDEEDEEVLFMLPKPRGIQHFVRDNGTPDSSLSYDSDVSEREHQMSCCAHILSCHGKSPLRRSTNVLSGKSYSQHSARNVASMEDKSENSTDLGKNVIDGVILPSDGDIDCTDAAENFENSACLVSSTDKDIYENEKGNTPEKEDLNHHKDDYSEKEIDGHDVYNKESLTESKEADLTETCVEPEHVQESSAAPEDNKNMGNALTETKRVISPANKPSNRLAPRKTVYSFEEIIAVLEEKIQVKIMFYLLYTQSLLDVLVLTHFVSILDE